MKNKNYSEKLKDPRWQKLRLQVLERDEWHCRKCRDGESTLHVHHCNYEKGKEPWEYPLDNFITLCENCHEDERVMRNDYEQMLLLEIRDKKFLADDVFKLYVAFLKLKIKYAPEYTASIIEFCFSDGWDDVVSLFQDYLHKKIEQTKNE